MVAHKSISQLLKQQKQQNTEIVTEEWLKNKATSFPDIKEKSIQLELR